MTEIKSLIDRVDSLAGRIHSEVPDYWSDVAFMGLYIISNGGDEERAEIVAYRERHTYKETIEKYGMSGDTLNRILRENRQQGINIIE